MKQIKIGSYESKKQFCRRFVEGCAAESDSIFWPSLDRSTLELIQRIPLWARLYQTKRHAAQVVNAFADTLSDSMLKEAIALQGRQAQRHVQVIESFMQAYGIPVPRWTDGPLPQDLEAAYIDLGFRESLDAVLGFGFYRLAVETQALPEALLLHFDTLLEEEACYTVFFINWFAYHQTKIGKIWTELRGAAPIWQMRGEILRLLMAFGKDDDEDNILFSLFGRSKPERVTALRFLTLCQSENEHRMSHSAAGLEPHLAPLLVSLGRSAFQFWPHRKANSAIALGQSSS